MDWKPYYDRELRRPGTRDKIADWLRTAGADGAPSATNDGGTVVSFPHTAIDYSGPIQARVVANLYRAGVRRVIALGVMHTSLVPMCRVALDETASQSDRTGAFARVSGAFVQAKHLVDTPFGEHPVEPLAGPMPDGLRLDDAGLLQREFSLDTFHAVLRLAADVLGVEPLPVLPLYVGMTRHPITGSLQTAATLACWLRARWDEGTAVVATGDVVHYGAVYGVEEEGASSVLLEARFRGHLRRLFQLALAKRDLETAYQLSLHELKSDQREMLPLLAYLLGDDACAELLMFELSDYASILDVASPCLVASALIEYRSCNVLRRRAHVVG